MTASNVNSQTAKLYVRHPDGRLGWFVSRWGDSVSVRFSDSPVVKLKTRIGLPDEDES